MGYSDDDKYEWGNFYLPDMVHMEVLGFMEGILEEPLVLMTCEDKKVYGFDGEQLHLVSPSLETFKKDQTIQYPGSQTFYNGEAFRDMVRR